jgi:hypothetical protein
VLHGVAKAYLAVLAAQAEQEVIESRRHTAERFVADVKAIHPLSTRFNSVLALYFSYPRGST